MKATFADTFFYLAMANPADEAHKAATELSRSLSGRTVTTAWVLTEVADALSAPGQRQVFLDLLDQLVAARQVTIVPPTQQAFDRGVELYRNRPDKEWSLTDCISLVVMKDHGIDEALTADHHFEQAGFKALLA